jgi:hypothetical protein
MVAKPSGRRCRWCCLDQGRCSNPMRWSPVPTSAPVAV